MAKLTSQKIEAIRSEYRHRRISGKYPRQKMLPEYTHIYPWVVADELDPYFVFCTVCECRLSAKKSDLGKHEGSIKHKENASKRKIEEESKQSRVENLEYYKMDQTGDHHDHNDANDEIYIKQEPLVEMVEDSSATPNFDTETESDHSDGADDTDDQNSKGEQTPSCNYTNKRRTSADSQSQNSSIVDYLPLPAPLTDTNPSTNPRLSACEVTSKRCPAASVTSNTSPFSYFNNITSPLSFAAQASPLQVNKACKITIKKVAAPLPSTAITSTATITPVPATSIRISQQPQRTQTELCGKSFNNASIPMHCSNQLNATTSSCLSSTSPTPVRNSFDLFFESICASVKALPPKLATEGKIRVMQLIGELEMRAIDQREQAKSSMQNATSTTK